MFIIRLLICTKGTTYILPSYFNIGYDVALDILFYCIFIPFIYFLASPCMFFSNILNQIYGVVDEC